jgi:ribosomal protein L7/L12
MATNYRRLSVDLLNWLAAAPEGDRRAYRITSEFAIRHPNFFGEFIKNDNYLDFLHSMLRSNSLCEGNTIAIRLVKKHRKEMVIIYKDLIKNTQVLIKNTQAPPTHRHLNWLWSDLINTELHKLIAEDTGRLNKIRYIKRVRELSGLGLRDAKGIVDRLYDTAFRGD